MRRHTVVFLAALSSVAALVFCLNLAEYARRGARAGVAFFVQVEMSLMQTPDLLIRTLPLVMLLAALISHLRLSNRNTILALRATGHTPAHLLAPTVIGAVVIGILFVALINPISSQLVQRLDLLEARYFSGASSRLTVSGDGIWLRQSDRDGQSVIHARTANGAAAILQDVEVYRFDQGLYLFEQISADAATLGDQQWELSNARVRDLNERTDRELPLEVIKATHVLSTHLTPADILESFAPPSAHSVWQLPEFIRSLEASGFDAGRHRTQLWFLLTLPATMAVMSVLAAVAGMRHPSLPGRGLRILLSLAAGTVFYSALAATQIFTASNQLPAAFAMCSAVAAGAFAAVAAYLHWEPG